MRKCDDVVVELANPKHPSKPNVSQYCRFMSDAPYLASIALAGREG